ncbi:MAG: type II toxin-antitoxin system RelE/ParE family toxin [Thermomicrobiales bacterium]|nr:type II toxin-antitoxin system RelE/ParE family toxin [Thermomicrobiales bacterium]
MRSGASEVAFALMRLEKDPNLGHALTGDLAGYRSLDFNLKGSGAYRAIYRADEVDRVILVYMVGPHENIYVRAKRRLQG